MRNNAVNRFNLSGKVAFVVGGGGYLGQYVCRGLAEHGAVVVIGDVNQHLTEKTMALLQSENLPAEAMELDIGNEESVKSAFNAMMRTYRHIDIVVNMSYYSTGCPMNKMSMSDFEKGLHISLSGAFVLSREAGRVMSEKGKGSIIHFSSMYGKVSPDPRIYAPNLTVNPVDYGVAKAGILQLVRYQAVMLGPCGVRVNAVVPGPFPNPVGQGANADFVQKLSSKVPLNRVGNAEEIVGAVVFLASDAASFITGAEIVVDGGWTAW